MVLTTGSSVYFCTAGLECSLKRASLSPSVIFLNNNLSVSIKVFSLIVANVSGYDSRPYRTARSGGSVGLAALRWRVLISPKARGSAARFTAVREFRKRNGKLFVEVQSDLVLKLNIVFFTKL
jgi:hypothetical protein